MTSFARQYLLLTGVNPKDVIGGEVADAAYEGQISVASWNWSLKRNTSDEFVRQAASGAWGVRVNAVPGTFEISKQMDRSSLLMLNRMKAGEKLNATLTLVNGNDARFSLVITMKNARIIDYSMDAEDSDQSGVIKEDWTLNYDEITFEHKAEPPKGGGIKNFVSTHKRPAQSTVEKSDTKWFVDEFASLSKITQDLVARILKERFKQSFS